MLYTVGHRKSYDRYLAEQGSNCRKRGACEHYSGGSVFLCQKDAEASTGPDFAIYGLLTDIQNTYLGPDGQRYIIDACQIVSL